MNATYVFVCEAPGQEKLFVLFGSHPCQIFNTASYLSDPILSKIPAGIGDTVPISILCVCVCLCVHTVYTVYKSQRQKNDGATLH